MATPIYYSDISKIGKDFVGKRDILLLTNEQALLESVKNIIMTEPGERVMNPTFGCALSQYVFELEQIGPVSIVSMKTAINNAIRMFETRIDQLDINISENPDEHSWDVIILFNMKTSKTTQSITLDLNKIR
jgi:phage baseplate assembly protein W